MSISNDFANAPQEGGSAVVLPDFGPRRVKEIKETPEGTLVIFHDAVDHSTGNHQWDFVGQGFNNHDAEGEDAYDAHAEHGHYRTFACVCGATKSETFDEKDAATGVHLAHTFVCSDCGLERNEI